MCLMSSAEYGGGSLNGGAIFGRDLRSRYGVSRYLAVLVCVRESGVQSVVWPGCGTKETKSKVRKSKPNIKRLIGGR